MVLRTFIDLLFPPLKIFAVQWSSWMDVFMSFLVLVSVYLFVVQFKYPLDNRQNNSPYNFYVMRV